MDVLTPLLPAEGVMEKVLNLAGHIEFEGMDRTGFE